VAGDSRQTEKAAPSVITVAIQSQDGPGVIAARKTISILSSFFHFFLLNYVLFLNKELKQNDTNDTHHKNLSFFFISTLSASELNEQKVDKQHSAFYYLRKKINWIDCKTALQFSIMVKSTIVH
jgi:hypothetical protein